MDVCVYACVMIFPIFYSKEENEECHVHASFFFPPSKIKPKMKGKNS